MTETAQENGDSVKGHCNKHNFMSLESVSLFPQSPKISWVIHSKSPLSLYHLSVSSYVLLLQVVILIYSIFDGIQLTSVFLLSWEGTSWEAGSSNDGFIEQLRRNNGIDTHLDKIFPSVLL